MVGLGCVWGGGGASLIGFDHGSDLFVKLQGGRALIEDAHRRREMELCSQRCEIDG